MIDIFITVFISIGLIFTLLGSIGLIRFPDVYTRMHAAGLISGLGIFCVLIASLIFFVPGALNIKAIAVVAFGVLTAPVATHMIIRAAYETKVPLWKGSVIDELKEEEKAS